MVNQIKRLEQNHEKKMVKIILMLNILVYIYVPVCIQCFRSVEGNVYIFYFAPPPPPTLRERERDGREENFFMIILFKKKTIAELLQVNDAIKDWISSYPESSAHDTEDAPMVAGICTHTIPIEREREQGMAHKKTLWREAWGGLFFFQNPLHTHTPTHKKKWWPIF